MKEICSTKRRETASFVNLPNNPVSKLTTKKGKCFPLKAKDYIKVRILEDQALTKL